MKAESASLEQLLAAAATMAKARYCWAVTIAEDGSVNARPMGPQKSGPQKSGSQKSGPQKSPSREDPFSILFLTRRGSRKAREIGRTGRLSVVYQHDADDGYVTLIGRGVVVADRALLRARWQPAWNLFFPAGADERDRGQPWRLVEA
jgi:general stress protein 26